MYSFIVTGNFVASLKVNSKTEAGVFVTLPSPKTKKKNEIKKNNNYILNIKKERQFALAEVLVKESVILLSVQYV